MGLTVQKDGTGRPIYLNLFKIKLPLCAFVSILHRITGVALLLGLPILSYLLYTLAGTDEPSSFNQFMECWFCQWSLIALVSATSFHLMSGTRHMWHDFSGSHSLSSHKLSAKIMLTAWFVWELLMAIKLMGIFSGF